MDESNTGKLRKIIALALKKSPSRTPAHIASFVLEIAPELVQNWALERLAILVRLETKRMQPKAEPGPYQMFLEGFHDLAERLPLPGRGGVELATATIVDLRRSLKLARLRGSAKTRRTAQLIKDMEPYARTRANPPWFDSRRLLRTQGGGGCGEERKRVTARWAKAVKKAKKAAKKSGGKKK